MQLTPYTHLGPDSKNPSEGERLVEIIRFANNEVRKGQAVQAPLTNLRKDYFKELTLSGENEVNPDVAIADPNLRNILEQLQLLLSDLNTVDEDTQHGLGINNILFMSAELLLLKSIGDYALPFLLIEEPEAHLHPQLQHRLVNFLQSQELDGVQTVMTSHSPNLAASIKLKHLTLMKNGYAFPMSKSYTKLEDSDYTFLERFLDVTKANLFFARGVLIVEGDAEHILLPTIAKLIGRPFDEYGVTVVNVGHTGLFRYARIFQRTDGKDIGVKVACIGDLDIPSDYAAQFNNPPALTKKDYDIAQSKSDKTTKLGDGITPVYLSPLWTLEHDICLKSDYACETHIAIQLAKSTATDREKIRKNAEAKYKQWVKEGKSTEEIAAKIYQPLYKNGASKPEAAQHLAKLLTDLGDTPERYAEGLPDYLVEAIEYVIEPLGKQAEVDDD